MLSDSRPYKDQSQMDRGPEALGLKDTQLLTLQETGGPRSNPQIHTFLPILYLLLSWRGQITTHKRFMAKEQKKNHVLGT